MKSKRIGYYLSPQKTLRKFRVKNAKYKKNKAQRSDIIS